MVDNSDELEADLLDFKQFADIFMVIANSFVMSEDDDVRDNFSSIVGMYNELKRSSGYE